MAADGAVPVDAGTLLAKVIVDDMRVDVVFSKIFYVSLLQQPLTLDERMELLAEVDPALHASLKWLLESDLSTSADLEIYFDATVADDADTSWVQVSSTPRLCTC